MKIVKAILYTLVGLILILCIGVLVCAMTPSLTDMLADRVENITSANSGMGQKPSGTGGTWREPKREDSGEDIPGLAVTVDEGSGREDVSQPGIAVGQTGYEPPDSQDLETPASVSGKSGYEPVREEAEEIPEETESAPVGNTGSEYTFDEEIYPYYAMLREDMRSLYKQIFANALDLTQSFSPVVDVNVDELKTVFEAVYNDHPELFWLETGYSCKYLRSGKCVEIILKYNSTAQNLDQAKQAFEGSAEQILQTARGLESDLEKEQYVHDRLIQDVEYVLNASMNQSAYSALVQGRSVCAGYARAFQYLMQQLGIPCYYCTGFAGEDHAWNMIKLGDDYHNVDVTWDDTDTPTYDYFNKTDREFGTTHVRTGLSVYLPACASQDGAPADPNKSLLGQGADGEDSQAEETPDNWEELINPDPMEPLRWHEGEGAVDTGSSGQTGTGTDTGLTGTDSTGTDTAATGQDNTGTDTASSGQESNGKDTASSSQEDTGSTGQNSTGTDTVSTEPDRQENPERAGISGEDVRDTLAEYYEDCGKLLKEVGAGDKQFANVIPEGLWDTVEQAYNSGDYKNGYVEDALEALGVDNFVIQLQAQDLGGGYYRLYHNVYTY